MTAFAFTNGHVLLPDTVSAGVRIEVKGDRITALTPGPQTGAEAIDLAGGWLMPGFVDTQVNGGGGVLFNDDISVDAIRAIGAAHARFGTTGFLPTLISDDIDRVERALDIAEEAVSQGVPGVLGVHIEGPFLNPARKGIHEEAKLRRLDSAAIALLSRSRKGRVMVTIAPELAPMGAIRRLVGAGVIVSAGHTNADYQTMMAAFDEGMTGVTHLFNAMTPLGHREPGVVGAALDHGAAWCGLIADGVHVHPAAMRVAARALPADRLMLVTDAMPSVGAVEKDFVLQGKRIQVVDGICRDDAGTLAGSDLDMAGAVRMMARIGIDTGVAGRMASASPAGFLGLSDRIGRLAAGLRADWVWLDADLSPRGTWIGGRPVVGDPDRGALAA